MNGRIYDPLLGRFLSADRIVDGPLNLQGYNRYSYVKNNPLTFSDPTGYEAWNPIDFFADLASGAFFTTEQSFIARESGEIPEVTAADIPLGAKGINEMLLGENSIKAEEPQLVPASVGVGVEVAVDAQMGVFGGSTSLTVELGFFGGKPGATVSGSLNLMGASLNGGSTPDGKTIPGMDMGMTGLFAGASPFVFVSNASSIQEFNTITESLEINVGIPADPGISKAINFGASHSTSPDRQLFNSTLDIPMLQLGPGGLSFGRRTSTTILSTK